MTVVVTGVHDRDPYIWSIDHIDTLSTFPFDRRKSSWHAFRTTERTKVGASLCSRIVCVCVCVCMSLCVCVCVCVYSHVIIWNNIRISPPSMSFLRIYSLGGGVSKPLLPQPWSYITGGNTIPLCIDSVESTAIPPVPSRSIDGGVYCCDEEPLRTCPSKTYINPFLFWPFQT